MQFTLDPDVQSAIELLSRSQIPQSKLVGVTARIAELAPHVWGACAQEDVQSFIITPSPLSDAT